MIEVPEKYLAALEELYRWNQELLEGGEDCMFCPYQQEDHPDQPEYHLEYCPVGKLEILMAIEGIVPLKVAD